jgi:hypothetical protein
VKAELIYRRMPVGAWTDLAGLSDAAIVLAMRLRTGPETTTIPGLIVAGRAWPALVGHPGLAGRARGGPLTGSSGGQDYGPLASTV